MKINLAISSVANVLGLINEKNGSNITESQVTVDELIESDENPGDNTKITLSGKNGHGIDGTRSFYYGRVNVVSQQSPPTGIVILAPGEVGGEAVAKILTQLNIRLEDIAYDNWVFPTEGVDGGVDIWGLEGSPIYTPDVIRVTLTQSA